MFWKEIIDILPFVMSNIGRDGTARINYFTITENENRGKI